MPENPEVKVTLTAEDQGLSAALRQLSEQLKQVDRSQQQLASGSARAASAVKGNFTSISKAAQEMGNAIKLRLGNIPGLSGLGGALAVRAYEPIGKLAEQAGADMEKAFGAAGGAVLGFSGALVALGVAAAATTLHMMDLAQSIENTAAATGLSTDQVQEYTELAKEMNLDAGSLEQAFARMQSQLGEFLATGSATGSGSQYLVRILKEYNVQLTDTAGKLRPVNDILSDFYDQMQKIPDAATRSATELNAFGTRGKVIAQMFEEAQREGISFHDLLEKIGDSGVVLTENQLADNERTKASWDGMMRSIRGAATQYGEFIKLITTHPLTAARNIVQSGAIVGPLMTNATAGLGGAKTGAGGSGGNIDPAALAQIQANEKIIDQTEQRAALLKAGGEEQLKLQEAEAGLAAARAKGDKNLADSYQREIADLRTVISLEAARKQEPAAKKQAAEQQRIALENERMTADANINITKAFTEELTKAAKQHDEEQRKEREEANKAAELHIQTLEAEGKTLDANIAKIEKEAQAYADAGMDPAAVEKFKQTGIAQAGFENAAATTEQGVKSFDVEKQSIAIDQKSGKIGRLEAEREINALIAARLPLLEKQAQAELAAAKAAGNQEDIAKAQNEIIAIQNMKEQTKSLADQVRGPLTESFENFFDSVGKGTGTVAHQMAELAANFLKPFQKMFSDRLTEQIVDFLDPSTSKKPGSGSKSGGSGWSSILSGLPGLSHLFSKGGSKPGGGDSGSDFSSAEGDFLASAGMAGGGHVRGAGTSKSDSIPAMLSNGEYVMNARATSAIGVHNLDKLNFSHLSSGGLALPNYRTPTLHFAEGGMVPPPGQSSASVDMHVGLDEGLVLRHLSSKAAGRIVLNHLANNPKAAGKAISRAS